MFFYNLNIVNFAFKFFEKVSSYLETFLQNTLQRCHIKEKNKRVANKAGQLYGMKKKKRWM
jgi:hypothetical protein